MIRVPTDRFSYHSLPARCFSADASDLQLLPGETLGEEWILVTSTGPRIFRLQDVETREGDVLAWHYRGADDGGALTATIFND